MSAQVAEWVVVYRGGGDPLPQITSSAWLNPLGSFTDSLRGAGYCSLQQNVTMAKNAQGTQYLLQNVLNIAPDKVTWLACVQYGQQALHYFPVDLLDFNGPDLEGCLVDFTIYAGLMSIDIIDSSNGNTIFGGKHNIPGQLLSPMMNAYLAACGFGDGSTATFSTLNAKIVHESEPGTVSDLAFAMWPYTNAPGGFEGTLEGANVYEPYPEVAIANQITTYAKVGSWA